MTKPNKIPNIVVPTVRDDQFSRFITGWEHELKGCHLIVVEDRPKKTKEIRKILEGTKGFTYQHVAWDDIDKDLGKDSWIIPRQTDCVRSYGYLLALRNDPLFIATLDDDILPESMHLELFAHGLFYKEYHDNRYFSVLSNGRRPRGIYGTSIGCEVVHGGWLGSPDLSAEEQIKDMWISEKSDFYKGIIPKGSYPNICGMNLAWRPYITKYMYFGLQGKDYPIDRCGDIWCGYYLAKNNIVMATGYPFCYHTRASNVWANHKKEENAKDMSYDFIQWIENDKNTALDILWEHMEYWDKLKEAYEIWERLINEMETS